MYGIVVEHPWYDGDDWYITVDAAGEGENDYVIDNETDYTKGDVLEYVERQGGEIALTGAGRLAASDYTSDAVTVLERDGREIRTATRWNRVGSDAVMYRTDDGGD